jgi:chemotaxis protein methyltransferase CheR
MYGFRSGTIELTDTMFRVLRDFIYQSCGIFYADDGKTILESRLQQNVKKRQLTNFGDYYYFLKYDSKRDEEMALLIDSITIHETYFFRENKQLDTFMNEVAPELTDMGKKTRRLRIWSAGCATGEEPYTLSMRLLEHPVFRDFHIEIYATDISRAALSAARRGVYSDISFRSTDNYFQKTYFIKEETGYRIHDRVKQPVVFLHLNLYERERWGLLPEMDAIFCRNVLIYFDGKAKRRVIDEFYQKLKIGGFLLLGHSESLLALSTDFTMRHFKNDLLYQKNNPIPPVPPIHSLINPLGRTP